MTSYAKKLITERDAIDAKIEANFALLKSNNSTMDSPLIDEEGFPIASIDHYVVRQARHDINCLRNDRIAVTEKIEQALQEIHANVNSDGDKMETTSEPIPIVHRTSNTPFAVVSKVNSGSPAADSGIRVDDYIIQYGPLHFGNFTDMKQVAQVTRENENKVIRVTVLRKDRPQRLEITPRKWAGNGLLGCAIVLPNDHKSEG